MKKTNYTKFQRIVALLLFLNHTLISCSCKKNPNGDSTQQEQTNKQPKTGGSSTGSPPRTNDNQETPSDTSPTISEASHETTTNPVGQQDISIPPTEENLKAHLTDEEVINSIPFPLNEALISSDDEEEKDYDETEAAIQDKPSYQANPIPFDNLIPGLEYNNLATPNQHTPIPFSPLFQHTSGLPQKDSNLPTNPPSTYSSNNPSNKNNSNTVTPNLFKPKPKPNTTPSLPTQSKEKIATISPTKKQFIPLAGEQQSLAQRQQQARQQRSQDLPTAPGLTFTTAEGYSIQFTDPSATEAIVEDKVAPFQRSLRLPVKKQDPTLDLETLSLQDKDWQQQHLHTVLPEKDSEGKGLIYITENKKSLLGGSNKGEKGKCGFTVEKCDKPFTKGHAGYGASKQESKLPKQESRLSRQQNRLPEQQNISSSLYSQPEDIFSRIYSRGEFRRYEIEKYEIERAAHEAEMTKLYAKLEETQQRVAREVALERAQKKQAEKQAKLDEQKNRIEHRQRIIELLIEERQNTESRKQPIQKLEKFSPRLLKINADGAKIGLTGLTKSVSRNPSKSGFTPKQQDDIRNDFKNLNKFIRKAQKAVAVITHLLAHPEENWYVENGKKEPIYTEESLIRAQENVAALQAVQTQLENLVISRGENPASYQPPSRIARTSQEKQAYRHLETLFHNPANAGAIFKDLSAQADELLQQFNNQPHLRQQLLPQAQLLAEQFSKFHGIIGAKAATTTDLYAKADPITLATRPIEQGISHYQFLDVIEKAAFDYGRLLCNKFDIDVPSKNYYGEFLGIGFGKSLRNFFDNLAGLLEPGSELLTSLPKSTSLPTTAQAQATLLLDHGVKYIKRSGIAENFQSFVEKQSPLYQEAQNMLIYLIEKKQNGSPNPSHLQSLLKPFSNTSPALAVADNQKERDTSHQPVVANDVLVSATNTSDSQLNTAEIKQQDQAGKNLPEKQEQQTTNSSLQEKEKIEKKLYTPTQGLLNHLENGPIYLPERQEPIEQQPADTKSQPDNLPTDESAALFDQVCAEITEYFSDPAHAAELTHNAQQQVQELIRLEQSSQPNRSQSEQAALQQKANVLMEALVDLLDNFNDQLNDLNRQKESLEESHSPKSYVYLSTAQELNQISILENKIETIKKNLETTNKAISQLCYAFAIIQPDPKTKTSTVTSTVIEKALETALSPVPATELVKVLTGRSPASKTLDDAFTPAAETALDFIDGGKAIKAFGIQAADYIKKGIIAVFNSALAKEPDISFQPEFKSSDEALAVLDSYFQKASTIKTKQFREEGLNLLKQIEQLKRIEKHDYRTSQNTFILYDISPEGAELLNNKREGKKNNLVSLRNARIKLKAHLQPTLEELQNCHIRTQSISDTEDEAITDSSDDEQNYSRANIEQQKNAVAEASLIISAIVTLISRKPTSKGPNLSFTHNALKKANWVVKEVEKAIPKGFKQTRKFGFKNSQKIYEYNGKYYSKDVDGHSGGSWKVFEVRGGKLRRIGTADDKLNIFKK